MDIKLSLFIFSLFFTLTCSAKNQSFEIPNSEVIEITDSKKSTKYPVYIQLPRSYNTGKKHYPVVYLTDGPMTFPLATSAMKFPIGSRKMQEVIFVGIGHQKGMSGMDSRVENFTPYKDGSWRRNTGEGEQYIRFLKDDVISYINKQYRTLPKQNTFFGNSLGGLLGGYVLLHHPELFENYILGSPSFWFKGSALLSKEDFTKLASLKQSKRVFIAIGARETKALESYYEMVDEAKQFSNNLKPYSARIESKFFVIPDASHETAYPTTIAHGLYWLYRTK